MYKNLLAYDGNSEYRAALRQGAEFAAFGDAEVHLLAIQRPHATTPIADEVFLADRVNEE